MIKPEKYFGCRVTVSVKTRFARPRFSIRTVNTGRYMAVVKRHGNTSYNHALLFSYA